MTFQLTVLLCFLAVSFLDLLFLEKGKFPKRFLKLKDVRVVTL